MNAPCGDADIHGPHSWGDLNWCQGSTSTEAKDSDLVAALLAAEGANQHGRPCQVCVALRSMSEAARAGVERALAGTIGERTLAEILTKAGYTVGRRAVANHRREAHTP